MLRTLRPEDQQVAIDQLYSAIVDFARRAKNPPVDYPDRPRIMLQAPTGFGKTVVAGAIIERALAKGKRVLFTVPSIELIDQAIASFRHEGIVDIGVIQGDHELTNWDMPVQVISIQTLQNRAKIPPADLVLVDEAHRWYKFYEKWFFGFPKVDINGDKKITAPEWLEVPFIGLSATPWARGLGCYYNKLIVATTTEQLIERGHLSPFKAFAPSHPDLKGVRTVAGDFHEGDLSGAMQRGALTADIVDTWLRLGENRSTFCFAVDRSHARHLQEQFTARGVACGYLDGFTPKDDGETRDGEFIEGRKTIKEKFDSGEYRVICNVGVLTTGIDWDVRCIIMARPTKSEILFTQIIGRGLRTAEGKDYCLILDHSDNHIRLGYVTDIQHEALDKGKKEEKAEKGDVEPIALPKECVQCHYLKPPKMAKCPNCGFVAQPISSTKTEPGELSELIRKKDKAADKFTKPEAYGMLKTVATQKGHKDGWAAHKFRELFGVWPNHPPVREAPLIEPSPDMLNWLKSRQIAWAHSKKSRPPPSSPQSWRADDVLGSEDYLQLKRSIDAAFKGGVNDAA